MPQTNFKPTEINKAAARIAAGFPQDTVKVPIDLVNTQSVKLSKAEQDKLNAKETRKNSPSVVPGQLPIANITDLQKAINFLSKSNDKVRASAWIKKRANDLELENYLPSSWKKATEDELNMFEADLEKGEKRKGKKGTNESNVLAEKPEREAHNYDKNVLKTPANKTVTRDKPTKVTKGEEDEFEKGGEDSKGGKVIGHTKSGKPIYKTADHKGHKDFNEQDHLDAAEYHALEGDKGRDSRSQSKRSTAKDHDAEYHNHLRDAHNVRDKAVKKEESKQIHHGFRKVNNKEDFHNGKENGYNDEEAAFYTKHLGNKIQYGTDETGHDTDKLHNRLKKEGTKIGEHKDSSGNVHTAYEHEGRKYVHSKMNEDDNSDADVIATHNHEKKIKKSVDDEFEKAFESIMQVDAKVIESDPVEKAFADVIGAKPELNPIDKAFESILEKGGPGSGKHGVYLRGGSIGRNKDNYHPEHGSLMSTHEDPQEAKDKAKRMNKQLSSGEKSYYRMKYHVKPIKEAKKEE